MKGIVYKSTGNNYYIKDYGGKFITCRIKGKFRIKGIKTTNPAAVGDKVDFEIEKNKDTGVITKIYPRKNYLLRSSTNLSKQYHILAANIDKVFVIVSILNPETTTAFIDRILVTAKAYDIPAIIIINKTDLLNNNIELKKKKEELKKIYTMAGYNIFEMSAKTGYNIEILKSLMKNKTSMFTGHSGVGKSSLINSISPDFKLKTSEISKIHKQGKHTTTFAEMFDLNFNARIIDTPGIRGFGIIDMNIDEIDSYFPEIFQQKRNCKFNNCKHIKEPGCAVLSSVKSGKIHISRYKSYLSILDDINNSNNTYR